MKIHDLALDTSEDLSGGHDGDAVPQGWLLPWL